MYNFVHIPDRRRSQGTQKKYSLYMYLTTRRTLYTEGKNQQKYSLYMYLAERRTLSTEITEEPAEVQFVHVSDGNFVQR